MNLEIRYKREWTKSCVAGLAFYWLIVFTTNANPLRAVAFFAGTTILVYSCLSIRKFWKEPPIDEINWYTYKDREKR